MAAAREYCGERDPHDERDEEPRDPLNRDTRGEAALRATATSTRCQPRPGHRHTQGEKYEPDHRIQASEEPEAHSVAAAGDMRWPCPRKNSEKCAGSDGIDDLHQHGRADEHCERTGKRRVAVAINHGGHYRHHEHSGENPRRASPWSWAGDVFAVVVRHLHDILHSGVDGGQDRRVVCRRERATGEATR
jgi:hypothetical protein